MNEYLSDEELKSFISHIEEKELVSAPPFVKEKVFNEIDKVKQIAEYRRYKNKVIAGVAAVIILSSFLPKWTRLMPDSMNRFVTRYEKSVEEDNNKLIHDNELKDRFNHSKDTDFKDTDFKDTYDGYGASYKNVFDFLKNSNFISDLLYGRED